MPKKALEKKKSAKKPKLQVKGSLQQQVTTAARSAKKRYDAYVARRPHRSFRLTRRRDYKRALELPGYWAFTFEVWRTIKKYRRIMISFVIVYALINLISLGLLSQESYMVLSDQFFGNNEGIGFINDIGGLLSGLALFSATVAGSLTYQLDESQQAYATFLLLSGWLVVVWILRQSMAGHTIRLRDAIYSAGAPIAAMFVVMVVALIQLVPVAIGIITYNLALSSGLVDGGVEAMVFWFGIALAVVLSLYWVTSTFIAMIVVTLPGMYPFAALKTAGDLVVGRRLRILLRILWLLLSVLVVWAVILLPVIFIQGAFNITIIPLVPIVALILTSISILWMSAYVYLLYRRLIDDPTPPA